MGAKALGKGGVAPPVAADRERHTTGATDMHRARRMRRLRLAGVWKAACPPVPARSVLIQRSPVAFLGRHFTCVLQTRVNTWPYLSTGFFQTSIIIDNLMVVYNMHNYRMTTLAPRPTGWHEIVLMIRSNG